MYRYLLFGIAPSTSLIGDSFHDNSVSLTFCSEAQADSVVSVPIHVRPGSDVRKVQYERHNDFKNMEENGVGSELRGAPNWRQHLLHATQFPGALDV